MCCALMRSVCEEMILTARELDPLSLGKGLNPGLLAIKG